MENQPFNKKILFVASEFSGIAQTGGLGQVCRDLPIALKALGFDIRVVLPYYRQHYSGIVKLLIPSLHFRPGTNELGCAVYQTEIGGVLVYLVDHETYFNRPRLYDDGFQEYGDNPERFCLLSYAALEIADNLGFYPDIVHCNDWQTALIPLYLARKRASNHRFHNTKSLLAVHNGAFQGKYSAFFQGFLGLHEAFNPALYEEFRGINLLKGGIFLADAVSTVSPGYAAELVTPEGGHGLHLSYVQKGSHFSGILNGCDYDSWNPKYDPYLVKNYDHHSLAYKKLCKKDLLEKVGLEYKEARPTIGMVSRITTQKGFHYTLHALQGLLKEDLQIVLVGDGDKNIVQSLNLLKALYPEKFSFFHGYNENMAHQIEAGADLFLMPSLFEPCGLNQMYSLKYGTPPIVRAVGGLKDTVLNYDEKDPSHSDGFMFELPTAEAVYHTTLWAIHVFKNHPKHFYQLMLNGMKKNYSWEASCAAYEALYRRVYNGFSL